MFPVVLLQSWIIILFSFMGGGIALQSCPESAAAPVCSRVTDLSAILNPTASLPGRSVVPKANRANAALAQTRVCVFGEFCFSKDV